MLQMALVTEKGPIGIIGINHENWRRLQAGMPLDINIKSMTPPGTQIDRVIIHYAHTYEQVVDDMEAGGIPVIDKIRREAKSLDQALKEGR